MACVNSVILDGFTITFESLSVSGGNTTVCYTVSGNENPAHALSNFVVEVCPDNPNQFINFINIVSCTKQLGSGPIVPAQCSKVTTPNPSGNQVNLIGIKFDESVNTNETVHFCFTLDAVLSQGCVDVGLKAGTAVFQTTDNAITGPVCGQAPPPECDRTVPFCCYVTVPEGFSPVVINDQPVIASAIVSDCTFLCESTEETTGNLDTTPPMSCIFTVPSTDLRGCVTVQNALEIQNEEGNAITFVCCSTCVCIDETLCVSCPGCPTTPTNLSITVLNSSLDATFVDSCAGKSVFKITGLLCITFDCPACDL